MVYLRFYLQNIEDNKQELLVSIGFILFVLLSYFLTKNMAPEPLIFMWAQS